jgi:probable rRNA maturation factor
MAQPHGHALNLHVTAHAGKTYVAYVRSKLIAAHGILRPALNELSLALVGDAEMSRLHEQFMSIDGPTDVLTFPLEEGSAGCIIAGEVVVCVSEARRQSRTMRTTVQGELLLYALHGMLHLCGFDDRTAPGYHVMHRTEDEILRQLGVGPVFVPEPSGRGNRRRADRTGVK